jgi:8-oxo-dGTP pyrophosphatase MutT (NUDIX family)
MIKQLPSAAGVIVYQDHGPGNLFFLGLISLPEFQIKNCGIYDIPKGRIEPGELPLQCAIREALEEATIDITHLDSGPYTHDRLTVWLAESYQEPFIGINPTTGIQEHLSYSWLKPDIMEAQCLDYLKPHVQWARKYLGDK